MRKRLFLLAVISAIVLVVTACSGSNSGDDVGNEEPAASEGEIALKLVTFQGSGQADPIVEAFNEKYKGEIRLEYQNVANGAEALKIYQTQFSTGGGPDIIYAGGGEFKTLVDLEYLVDLSGKPFMDNIADDANESFTYNDGTWILAWDRWFEGLVVNKGLLDSIGAEMPQTYQDLIDIDKKLQEEYDDVRAFHFGGKENTWFNFHHGYFLSDVIADNREANAQWDVGEFNYADGFKNADQAFLDLIEAGLITDEDLGRTMQLEHDIFTQEKSAFLITYVGFVPDILNANPDLDLTITTVPTLGEDENWIPGGVGSGYGIGVNSEHQEEAEKFLEFVASGEALNAVIEADQFVLPALKNANNVDLPDYVGPAMEVVNDGKSAYMWEDWSNTGEYLDRYWTALQELVLDPSSGAGYVGEEMDKKRDE